MNSIVAEWKVRTALSRKIPLAANRTYKLEEEEVLYSGEKKELLGLFVVLAYMGETIAGQPENGLNHPISTLFKTKQDNRDCLELSHIRIVDDLHLNFYKQKS